MSDPSEEHVDPEKVLADVVRADGRYPVEAFGFLHGGLARAVNETHGERPEGQGPRHVSGRQLCAGLRDEARDRWGMLAAAVLAKWNIRQTLDFGKMVYLLVENDLMKKT